MADARIRPDWADSYPEDRDPLAALGRATRAEPERVLYRHGPPIDVGAMRRRMLIALGVAVGLALLAVLMVLVDHKIDASSGGPLDPVPSTHTSGVGAGFTTTAVSARALSCSEGGR